jgi:hypothetical protein
LKPYLFLPIAFCTCFIITIGCKKASTPLTIGTNYGGGIIVYMLQPNDPGYSTSVQHGLIAATRDLKTGMQWGNYVFVNASDTIVGAGKANTTAIVNACGSVSAAYLCHNITLDGYADWYLPSKSELNKLYIFNLSEPAIGCFASAPYWSSSTVNSDSAWAQGFENGGQGRLNKYDTLHVRAVRTF